MVAIGVDPAAEGDLLADMIRAKFAASMSPQQSGKSLQSMVPMPPSPCWGLGVSSSKSFYSNSRLMTREGRARPPSRKTAPIYRCQKVGWPSSKTCSATVSGAASALDIHEPAFAQAAEPRRLAFGKLPGMRFHQFHRCRQILLSSAIIDNLGITDGLPSRFAQAQGDRQAGGGLHRPVRRRTWLPRDGRCGSCSSAFGRSMTNTRQASAGSPRSNCCCNSLMGRPVFSKTSRARMIRRDVIGMQPCGGRRIDSLQLAVQPARLVRLRIFSAEDDEIASPRAGLQKSPATAL